MLQEVSQYNNCNTNTCCILSWFMEKYGFTTIDEMTQTSIVLLQNMVHEIQNTSICKRIDCPFLSILLKEQLPLINNEKVTQTSEDSYIPIGYLYKIGNSRQYSVRSVDIKLLYKNILQEDVFQYLFYTYEELQDMTWVCRTGTIKDIFLSFLKQQEYKNDYNFIKHINEKKTSAAYVGYTGAIFQKQRNEPWFIDSDTNTYKPRMLSESRGLSWLYQSTRNSLIPVRVHCYRYLMLKSLLYNSKEFKQRFTIDRLSYITGISTPILLSNIATLPINNNSVVDILDIKNTINFITVYRKNNNCCFYKDNLVDNLVQQLIGYLENL